MTTWWCALEYCEKDASAGIAWPKGADVRAPDLLEEDAGGTDARAFRAFEIKTVRVKHALAVT